MSKKNEEKKEKMAIPLVDVSENDCFIFMTSDKTEYLYAFHGIDFLLTLWDLDQWLREQVKYNSKEWEGKAAEDAFDTARDKLRELMESRNVSLEMLK